MFEHVSTLGWILIIGLAVFILALNLGLFLGIKQKMQKDNWIDKVSAAGQVLRNPLQKENDQLDQLADQVARIKNTENDRRNDEKE